jgi:uncharacterized protein YtpQ (UPF0354 family)
MKRRSLHFESDLNNVKDKESKGKEKKGNTSIKKKEINKLENIPDFPKVKGEHFYFLKMKDGKSSWEEIFFP